MFQQDTDPKHMPRISETFLEEKAATNEVKFMVWSTRRPNLSSIDLLWNELDRRAGMQQVGNEKRYGRWSKICQVVIKSKGGDINGNKVLRNICIFLLNLLLLPNF